MRSCRTYSAALILLLAFVGQAAAQCAGGLISNCPAAVNVQSGDFVQLWQNNQNPHMRRATAADFGSFIGSGYLPLTGGTMTGALNMGGKSAALSGGGSFVGTFSGTPTMSGAWTFGAAGTGLSVSNNARVTGLLTVGTNGANGLAFLDSAGGSPTLTTAGNNLQIKVPISGGGTAVALQIPSQVASSTATSFQVQGALSSQGIQLTRNVAYASGTAITGVSATGNSAQMWSTPTLTGTLNTGAGVPYSFTVTDKFVAGSSQGGIWTFADNFGAGYDGIRQPFAVIVNKTVAAATPAGPGGTGNLVTAVSIFQHIDHGDGGTSSAPYGNYTMFNPDLRVNTGDWVYAIIGTEADLRMFSGTNSPEKIIHAFHYGIGDGAHASAKSGGLAASFVDAAISIDASPTIGNGTGKGLNVIQLGNFTQDTPWDATPSIGSSLMWIGLNNSANLTAAQQAYIDDGFKLSALYVRGKFLDNGAFSVDGPTGATKVGLATLAPTSTGASLDVTGVVEQSATVGSGGAAAIVGAEIVDASGGIWQVATISGSGASATVATVTLVRAASVTSAPSNPVSATMANSTSAVTLNITWSSTRNTLQIQPGGGLLTMNGIAAVSCTVGTLNTATAIVTNGVITHC